MPDKKRTIVLLDLNYTLALKTGLDTRDWTYDVNKDVYSWPLANALVDAGFEVHLVTARTDNYQDETLAKIAADTKLTITKAIFKPITQKFKPVQEFKGEYLKHLLNSGEELANIMAIESNEATHKVYKSLGLTRIYRRDDFLKLVESGGNF